MWWLCGSQISKLWRCNDAATVSRPLDRQPPWFLREQVSLTSTSHSPGNDYKTSHRPSTQDPTTVFAHCAPALADDCAKSPALGSDPQSILISGPFAEEHLLTRSNTVERVDHTRGWSGRVERCQRILTADVCEAGLDVHESPGSRSWNYHEKHGKWYPLSRRLRMMSRQRRHPGPFRGPSRYYPC